MLECGICCQKVIFKGYELYRLINKIRPQIAFELPEKNAEKTKKARTKTFCVTIRCFSMRSRCDPAGMLKIISAG
jgi:hypothetical protein